MFSSENENVGFSAIGSDELERVNGGIVDPLSAFMIGLAIGVAVGYAIYHPAATPKGK